MPPPPPPTTLGTVLVVGGCGFLGSHVVDQLLGFPTEEDEDGDGVKSAQASSRKPRLLSTAPRPDAATLTFPTLKSRYPSYVDTKVHVLDLRCTRNRLPGAVYHEADITDKAQLEKVFEEVRPDVVINTASAMYDAPKAVLQKVNVEGTRTLIEVAGKSANCRAFVHTSSSSVIHDSVSNLVFADERWPLFSPNVREFYSETKVEAEEIVLGKNGGGKEEEEKGTGMLTCAIRPAGIVGECDRNGITWGLLETAKRAPEWNLRVQIGEGSNLFDTTYVGNVAYAHLLAAKRLLATAERVKSGKGLPLSHERVDGEAFIVTNDSPAYFWDTSRFVWAVYGRAVDIERVWVLGEGFAYAVGCAAELAGWVSGRKGKLNRQTVKYACMTRTYGCGKARRRLGYQPAVGLEEGLSRAVRWYRREELVGVEREGRKGE